MFLIEVELASGVQAAMTFWGLAIAHRLIELPWTVRLVTASLVGLDPQLKEAALAMGARPFTAFRLVTWPLIRPGVVAGALFAFIASFVDLEKSLFLVGPGVTTLPIVIVNYLEWSIDPTIAALATVQIAIISAGLVVTDRYFKLARILRTEDVEHPHQRPLEAPRRAGDRGPCLPRSRPERVHRLPRPLRLRQDHDPAHDRRPHRGERRLDPVRRAGRDPPAALSAQRRPRVPGLCPVPAHARRRERRLRAPDAQGGP